MHKSLTIIILLLAIAATILPARAAYETGGVAKTILSNGTTVLVRREPEAKVAAIDIFVRVGAQDENSTNTGIGQLLAGSILAGSRTYSEMRLARYISEVGGNLHALWQWNYIEIYAVTLPDSCEDTISLLADAIKNSSLSPVAVEYSKSAILKEIQRQNDDPFNSAYTALRQLVHHGTPYDRPYLGDSDKIKSITSKQLQEFYNRNFSGDRIVVSVVGDVDPESVRRKIETCFKNMPIRKAGTQPQEPVKANDSREMTIQKNASATYIMLGYPAPGVDDKDYAAMCVANVLLGGNKSSLLFTKLREERGLGYQVGSLYPTLRNTSHIAAYLGMDAGRATPDAVKLVQDSMLDQFKALGEGKFTDDDLERAKRFLKGHHTLLHERTRDRAYQLGWAEAIGLGYQYDFQYGEKINRVTREDVLRACSRFFTEPSKVILAGNNQ